MKDSGSRYIVTKLNLNRIVLISYNYQNCRRKYLRFSISVEKGWDKLNFFRQWLFSWFLWLLSGYGYRLGRAFIAYVTVILAFGLFYWCRIGLAKGFDNSDPIYAIVESINVFHGRGISSPDANNFTGHILLIAAGLEAIFALIIEVTFIAALTQKFFGK